MTTQTETVVLPAPAVGTGVKEVKRKVIYDPQKEYVAGDSNGLTQAYARALPEYIDDLTQDLGADLYERMLVDAQVAGDIKALRLSVLSNGVNLLPAVSKNKPRYKKAVAIQQFCERLLERLPMIEVLSDMLRALAVGNRVAELVWRVDDAGFDNGKLVLDRIKVKARRTVALVTDNRSNLVGVVGALAGGGNAVIRSGTIVDPSKSPQFLPRGKFAVLTHAPKDSDPRGTSVLRPAYNPWWLKQQAWADLLRHLAQVGGGVLVGYTSEHAGYTEERMPDGTVTAVSPSQAMQSRLMEIRGGSCAAFPYGSKVEALAVPTASAPFFDAIDLYDRQISKAILGQTLTTNEGKHQSRAASGQQKDVFDLIVEFEEIGVSRMIRQDILQHAVAWNFGDAAIDLVPICTLSQIEESDLAGLAEAVAKLQSSGYLSTAQLPELDAKLGLTIRPDEPVLLPDPVSLVGEETDEENDKDETE